MSRLSASATAGTTSSAPIAIHGMGKGKYVAKIKDAVFAAQTKLSTGIYPTVRSQGWWRLSLTHQWWTVIELQCQSRWVIRENTLEWTATMYKTVR
jgi:hypothetical protein